MAGNDVAANYTEMPDVMARTGADVFGLLFL